LVVINPGLVEGEVETGAVHGGNEVYYAVGGLASDGVADGVSFFVSGGILVRLCADELLDIPGPAVVIRQGDV
jgi:hypothetical protein